MTDPPDSRPPRTDPGGIQARADGQRVEVRNYEGELIRVVNSSVAQELVRCGLADELGHGVRLKLGIRWLPPRLDRPSGRPDLDRMQRRNPDRYAALWRGTRDSHQGKGALGRAVVDASVRLRTRK